MARGFAAYVNEITARAFDLLLQAVNGNQKASSAVIQPSLFLRKSTGPAPSSR
jgi:DNA-binding LacI/PurR family transcriptional regulator